MEKYAKRQRQRRSVPVGAKKSPAQEVEAVSKQLQLLKVGEADPMSRLGRAESSEQHKVEKEGKGASPTPKATMMRMNNTTTETKATTTNMPHAALKPPSSSNGTPTALKARQDRNLMERIKSSHQNLEASKAECLVQHWERIKASRGKWKKATKRT